MKLSLGLNLTGRRVAAIAALTTLTGGTAMADVTRVIIDNPAERPIVTNGDILLGVFRTEVKTQDADDGAFFPDAMTISFRFDDGNYVGGIRGNDVAFPTFPLRTLSFFAEGHLELLGRTLDGSGEWVHPFYDSDADAVDPAGLMQFNEFGAFQFQESVDGDMRYIGFADADLTRFGYVQIQRESLTQWRLIGYAYGQAGEPVDVEDLTVPVPPAPAVVGVAALTLTRRQRLAQE